MQKEVVTFGEGPAFELEIVSFARGKHRWRLFLKLESGDRLIGRGRAPSKELAVKVADRYIEQVVMPAMEAAEASEAVTRLWQSVQSREPAGADPR